MAFTRNTSAPKIDIYQTVTDKIIAAIEAGAGNWRMPWHNKADGALIIPPVSVNGHQYRGINVPLLWIAAMEKGYTSNVWGVFNAWKGKKASVRKGEKATYIVLMTPFTKKDKETGEEKKIMFAKGFAVFNADQVDGYTAPAIPATAPTELPLIERIEHAENFFKAIPATVVHGGNKACYIPAIDQIKLPDFDQFKSPEDYYATRGHETIHWSGTKARCDRDMAGRFGSEAYAGEELVAELGAAFLCAILGISNEPRPDHAQYMANWLKALKANNRAIVTAASKAQQAVDYLVKLATESGVAADGGMASPAPTEAVQAGEGDESIPDSLDDEPLSVAA